MVLVSCGECFSDFLAPVAAYWNILKVGIVAGQTTRHGNRLSISGVHPSCIGVDQLRQGIHISRPQFGEFPEGKDIVHDWKLNRQFLQHILTGLVLAGFGFFRFWIQHQFFKQYFTQLLGRSKVEPHSSGSIHRLFRNLGFFFQGF